MKIMNVRVIKEGLLKRYDYVYYVITKCVLTIYCVVDFFIISRQFITVFASIYNKGIFSIISVTMIISY